MTQLEFILILGYLANPNRGTTIEVEIKEEKLADYIESYEVLTGSAFPTSRVGHPVQVIPAGGNKWGREMRLYFNANNIDNIPDHISDIMTSNQRPGYESWNRRVNSNSLIDNLLATGFIIGSDQNEDRIRGFVSPNELDTFQQGYNLN